MQEYNTDDIGEESEVDPIVDWKNPPKVSDLKADIEEASRDHTAHISEVDKWLNLLEGKPKNKLRPRHSNVVPKVIRKSNEWRYASLSEPFLSTDDLFNTEPVTFEDKEGAVQNGLILNNQFNTKLGKVDFIDEYVRTSVDEGTVIVKLGWTFEEREVTLEKPVMGLVQVTDPQEAQALQQQGLPPIKEGIIGYEEYQDVITVKNHPSVEVCDYRDVIIDPTCKGKIGKAGFIGFAFDTNYSELKKDSRYTNLDFIRVDDTQPVEFRDHQENSSFTYADKPRKKLQAVEYWGFWDIHGTGIVVPIVATWVGTTMIRLEENPYPDKELPFVVVQHLPRRRHVYGEPDGALIEDNQDIIGATTRGMLDIMGRAANGQQGMRKDALDPINKRRFELGQDYMFEPNVDPKQAFHMAVYPEMPRSAFDMINYQSGEAESLTGVKAFTGGISGNGLGTTATGVRSAMDATSKRELGILRRLATGITEIGRKMMAMNGEMLDEEEVIRITNEEFVRIKRDDLAGDFDIRLSISTAEADNEKAQELAFMLQTGQQSQDPDEVRMIRAEIARLRGMPTLAKKIESFQPKVDPLTQKRQELEIAKLEAEIMERQSRAQENQYDMQLKAAKTQNELAKAKQSSSKADLDDQTFMSNATGRSRDEALQDQETSHMQDMDKEAIKALESDRSQSKPAQ